MKKFKRKGFTLIELIAVLVIMAIIALIVTPLVMSIIRKARVSADKRSIDAYGRSIELAIASYLLDNGTFPTDISQLTIEYSGDKVECTTTQINTDSSIYLSDCKVNNREVSNYTYGTDKSPSYQTYSVGDTVIYNDISFYVIKDSGPKEDTVTLLKAEPLTVDEVKKNYEETGLPTHTVSNVNGYGDIPASGSNSYLTSNQKIIVDSWSLKTFDSVVLYDIRLIKVDDLIHYLGFKLQQINPSTQSYKRTSITPEWIFGDYEYATMDYYNDSNEELYVNLNGELFHRTSGGGIIRPVVELYKSALN